MQHKVKEHQCGQHKTRVDMDVPPLCTREAEEDLVACSAATPQLAAAREHLPGNDAAEERQQKKRERDNVDDRIQSHTFHWSSPLSVRMVFVDARPHVRTGIVLNRGSPSYVVAASTCGREPVPDTRRRA
jgi:hypothetical protein